MPSRKLMIIQAKKRKAKSSGGNSMNAAAEFGDGKTLPGDVNNGLGEGKSRIWGAVFLIWGREVDCANGGVRNLAIRSGALCPYGSSIPCVSV